MHQVFRSAIFNRAPTVLGRTLRPFSLAHAYVLLAFDSPYFRTGADPTVEDMALLVWICSQDAYPFDRITDAMLADDMEDRMAEWAKAVRYEDIPAEAEKLQAYLVAANDHPPRYFEDGKRRDPRVPWPLVLFVKVKRAGIETAEAWNMPMALATSIKLTLDWLEGDDSLQSEHERQIVERNRKAAQEQQEAANVRKG